MSRINIKSLSWKNFRSYGEVVQHIEFPDDRSDLILLYGPNGGGKSTIQDTIDFLFFKKVRGKKRTWASMASLPNRDNDGGLWARIEFTKDDREYVIERGVSPTKLEFTIDGVPHPAKSKPALESEIAQLISFDVHAFKTFISVNANDFKNFIHMKKAEKERVLDKIFNLDILNDLSEIVRNFHKGTLQQIDIIEGKLEVFQSNLRTLDNSAREQWTLRREELAKRIKEAKGELTELKAKVQEAQQQYKTVEERRNSIRPLLIETQHRKSTIEAEAGNLKRQLKIFENDVCPTCKQDIREEHKDSISSDIKKRGKELVKQLKETTAKVQEYSREQEEVDATYNKHWQQLEMYKQRGRTRKSEYDSMIAEHAQEMPAQPQFDADRIKADMKEMEEDLSELRHKSEVQKRLMSLLQKDGIKGRVISSLVPLLNRHINEYLDMMSFRYDVEMNDDFSATIIEHGEEIDPDQLSEGEDKIINIALMFSYLSIIKSGGLVNVLFIDEIFSYIDLDNISLILVFLREWISRYDTNVIVVNHQMPGDHYFDRTWRVERNLHSQLVEETAV